MNWVQLLGGDRQEISGQADRSAFERDYDRIIFSHPFRRLQDKTQVFPLPEQDFVHTRLTHSLEVSSVGRSLGKSAGEQILKRHSDLTELGITRYDFGAIVSAACLTHDLGNPPFGHTGEDAISDYFRSNSKGNFFQGLVSEDEWQDLLNFEGNAQGFRILTDAKYQGLKLTTPTLAAFTKYPRPSLFSNQEKQRKSQKKFGYFQSEKDTFQNLAAELGLRELESGIAWCRHPLAFLVEAADDICYHIIDLEDGCQMGLVEEAETIGLFAGILGDKFKPEKLQQIPGRNEKISLLRAVAIGILIDQCTKVFIENEDELLSGDFDSALTDLIPSKAVLDQIINVSIRKLYRSRMVLEIEAGGFEVLGGLLEAFTTAAYNCWDQGKQASKRDQSVFRLLPDGVKSPILSATSTYQMLRQILDFISGLTDRHAVSLYRKIRGTSLAGWGG